MSASGDRRALGGRGPILAIGGGKMGGALIRGWLDEGLTPSAVTLIDPNAAAGEALAALGVHWAPSIDTIAPDQRFEAILLAVKPQMMAAALPSLRPFVDDALVISIAAGVSIEALRQALGERAAIVRAMPNTPAAVGAGASALVAGEDVDPGGRALAQTLLEAVGLALWLEDEEQMHAVTALSGGGPAYVFQMVENLAAAGAALGLAPDLAMTLARETVGGAGKLLAASDEDAAQLRRNVTSPGGTTQAALAVLMAEDGAMPLYARALAAASNRSRELDID